MFPREHGRVDAGVRGLRDAARLGLQHGGRPELRGAAAKRTEIHPLHRGLPASASEVGRSRQVQREHGQTVLMGPVVLLNVHSHNSRFP